MAGHSHFANIKHKKAAQDAKKGKLFTKVQREIIIAIKSGSPDPSINSKLQNAITKARYFNLPKDRIDNVIKKYSSGSIDESYENIRYNVSPKHGISLIIECLSDNKNRTAGEVRAIATKHGGNLVETGSLEFNFDKVGIITYNLDKKFDEIFEIASQYEIQDIEENEGEVYITTTFENIHKVYSELKKELGEAQNIETLWQPKQTISLNNEQTEYFNNIVNAMEDLDDVQDVYHNVE